MQREPTTTIKILHFPRSFQLRRVVWLNTTPCFVFFQGQKMKILISPCVTYISVQHGVYFIKFILKRMKELTKYKWFVVPRRIGSARRVTEPARERRAPRLLPGRGDPDFGTPVWARRWASPSFDSPTLAWTRLDSPELIHFASFRFLSVLVSLASYACTLI